MGPTSRAAARRSRWAAALGALTLILGLSLPPGSAAATVPGETSSEARQAFERARTMLLQIRTLTLPSRAQAATGSGFIIGESGLVVTNYHVVAQAVYEQRPYALEYVGVDGTSGALEIVAFDVQHDLALLRRPGERLAHLELAPAERELRRGDRIFSLGKPLDLGFAVIEGLYNGVVERDLYGHLLFSGALNSGMSGGPTLDVDGRVIGINVARRLDGQLVSFLIPVRHLHALLARAPRENATLSERRAEIGRQLIAHQATMTAALLATAWPTQTQGPYRVPVMPEALARCWGNQSTDDDAAIKTSQTQCSLAASRYVSGGLALGSATLSYRYNDSVKLGAWRFWQAMSRQFGNRIIASSTDPHRTAPRCEEEDLDIAIGRVRVVLCLQAYSRFAGLYVGRLLAITADRQTSALVADMHVDGVTEPNLRRLARNVIEGLARERAP